MFKTRPGYRLLKEFIAELTKIMLSQVSIEAGTEITPATIIKASDFQTSAFLGWADREYNDITLPTEDTTVENFYKLCLGPIIFRKGNKFKYPKNDDVVFQIKDVNLDEDWAVININRRGELDGKETQSTVEDFWYPFKTGEYVMVPLPIVQLRYDEFLHEDTEIRLCRFLTDMKYEYKLQTMMESIPRYQLLTVVFDEKVTLDEVFRIGRLVGNIGRNRP